MVFGGKKQQKMVELFYSGVSLFAVWFNRRQLDSHFFLLNKFLGPWKSLSLGECMLVCLSPCLYASLPLHVSKANTSVNIINNTVLTLSSSKKGSGDPETIFWELLY